MEPSFVCARPRRTALIATIALAAACSDESPDGIRIPTTGGTIDADSSRITLVIPSGALSSDTHIDVRLAAAPTDAQLVGDRSYDISPEGLRFSVPATITLRPAGTLPTGNAASELAIAVSVNGGVTEVPATLDASAGTVTAQLSTLGDLWVRRMHVASITLDRTTAQLDVERTLQLQATSRAANGRTLISPVINWSSDNQGVALVNPTTGFVSAVSSGTARITARSEGREAQATIVVVRRSVQSVQIIPSEVILTAGQTTTLTSVLRDSVQDPIIRVPTWLSLNPEIATVNNGGIVTAVSPGTATISATADGRSANATVIVRPQPIRIASVRDIATGEAVPLTAIAGSVAIDVEVNPEQVGREVVLTLACAGRPDLVIARHPHQTPAGATYAFAAHTAAFDQQTGFASTPNGACELRATIEYTTGQTRTATPVAVTLANTSRFIAGYAVNDTRTTVLGIAPVRRAVGVGDLLERQAGNVTLTLLGVNYAPGARITAVSGTFLGRTFTNAPATGDTHRFVIEFPNIPATTASPLGVGGYTSQIEGDVPVLSSITVSSGPTFTAVTAQPLRIDNAAPQVPLVLALPGATTVAGTPWVPGTYAFDRPDVFASRGDTTGGVGVASEAFYGQRTNVAGLPNGFALGADCASTTIIPVTTAADLRALRLSGQPATANEFRLRVVEWDRLGNIRCTDLPTTFGVLDP
jgi:hypothetical protein